MSEISDKGVGSTSEDANRDSSCAEMKETEKKQSLIDDSKSSEDSKTDVAERVVEKPKENVITVNGDIKEHDSADVKEPSTSSEKVNETSSDTDATDVVQVKEDKSHSDTAPDPEKNTLPNGETEETLVEINNADDNTLPESDKTENSPVVNSSQFKGPRAKMTLSPNKAPQTKSIAHYFQAMSKGARKSLSNTFTDHSNDNNSIKSTYNIDGDSAKDTEAMKKALNIALEGKANSPGIAEALLAPRQPKARKSFQPRASSSRESTPLSIKSNSSSKSGTSIANMTIKLPELENALGIKRRSLDKLDAKTFDQIVLAKASRMGQPVIHSQPATHQTSPNSRSLLKPLHEILAESAKKRREEREEALESANISAVITSQKILKKRKRKKMGTYKLPGAKKEYKKKTTTIVNPQGKPKTWSQKSHEINSNKAKVSVSSVDHANEDTEDETEVPVKLEPASQDSRTNQEPSAAETDDSYMTTESQQQKKKKVGRKSKWQKGCLPSKKYQKKTNAAFVVSKIQVKKDIQEPKRSSKENSVLRDALSTAVKEPIAELETLNQVIANLSEDNGNGIRRSGRKRKANELDDGSSVASSGIESDSGIGIVKKRKIGGSEVSISLNDKESVIIKKRKTDRESPSVASEESSSMTISRSDRSSPLPINKTARASSKMPTPTSMKKIDNQLGKQLLIKATSRSKTPDAKSYTQTDGSVPGLFRKKISEGEQAAVPSSAQSHKQVEGATVHKYINTPNGLSYPITIISEPSGADQNVEVSTQNRFEGTDKDRDFIPLCCCKVTGNSYTNSKQVMYCQALDSIHGKVVGCCNRVSNKQLIRPAIKIPFMAVCEAHRQRMKQHQCCPGCGHFCTEGKFLQCRKDHTSKVVHYFHRQCQVFKDNKYYCPHCGEESLQFEVTLRLSEQQIKASFLARDEPKLKPAEPLPISNRARMSMDKTSEQRQSSVTAAEENLVTTDVAGGKKLTSDGLPGPAIDDLKTAIAVLEADKSKKLRIGPKTLYGASKVGDVEKVLYMLKEGTDPNTKFDDYGNQTALHAAAEGGCLLVAHMLLQTNASPHVIDDDLRTPLMNAAEQGHVDVMKLLIKCGAHVQLKDEDGMTCLHLAAKCGKTDAVKYLVNTKLIDVNVTDDGGWTPIIWAAEHRHISTVGYLVEAGADPNIKDNEENTGLHWAAFAGSVDIAELFLNAGCAIEGANMHGDRPLHIASRQDHYECVVLFLARGADSEARNNDNEAAISCCIDKESQCWMALRVNRTLKGIAAQRIGHSERLLHRDISMGRENNAIPVVNSVDDANYPEDFLYVADYVETSPINVNRVITSLQSCKCRDNCTSLFCVCGRNSIRCWYETDGRLVNDFNFSDPPLVFECNKACRCWTSCANRVVQLGVTCRLQVFRTAGRGWGARTLLDIPQGAFVCEYIGELITDAEADSREDDSYLFDLDNKDADTFCIDARKYGNISRFVNHLCEPNLTPVKVFVDHQDLRFPRICFFASRDIKAHEELGFDYGEKFWIIKWKQFTCTCSSPKCRYSKDTIHTTLEEYNRRQEEELNASQ